MNQQDLSQTRLQGHSHSPERHREQTHLCTSWYLARTAFQPQKLLNAEHNGSPLWKDKKNCSLPRKRPAVFSLLLGWCCLQSLSPTSASSLTSALHFHPSCCETPVVAAPSWAMQGLQKTFSPVPPGARAGRWRDMRVAAHPLVRGRSSTHLWSDSQCQETD